MFNKLILILLLLSNTQYVYSSNDTEISSISNQKKFEGYQVKFDYKNYPQEREIAYKYYLDVESKYMPDITKDEIGIDLYDIDGDSKKEILVYVNGGDRCPRAGCPFATLRKCKDGSFYKEIPWFIASGTAGAIYEEAAPKILNSVTLGFHDILFGEKDISSTIWKWNGRFYDIYKVFDQK